MRIPDLNNSDSLIGNFQRLNSRQTDLSNQVTTGQRISKISDDPAAAARVLQLQQQKQRLQQYAKNGDQALAISQTTYASITTLKSVSDRAGELSVLGVGATDSTAYTGWATEVNQLIEQSVSTLNSTYDGQQLFGGTKTDAAPFTATRDASGNITAVTYTGSTDSQSVNISENSTVSPYSSGTTNQKLGDFITRLIALRDGLQNGDSAAVQAVQPGLSSSEDDILGTVATIGTTQTRIEGDRTQMEARYTELEKLTSAETDADMSTTIVKLTQTQTAYQAALQVGAQVLRVSLLDYLR